MLTVIRKATLSRFLELSTNSSSLRARIVVARMMSSCNQDYDQKVVPKDEVIRFIKESMCKVGTMTEDACIVAHQLMVADYRGHFSHGMNRLEMYITDIEKRITDPTARPQIINDFQAVALVDGKNGLGQVVGKYCMELAIEKAKKFGIGMVAARGSNHYGISGYYTMMAMEQGLIGFNCTNTSPLMVPTRSTKSALGTNPLSFGMSTCDGDEFLLDMATTAVALGKIELAVQKNENIPEGWALGSDGKVTCNAEEAYRVSSLLPLGGSERNSGYKGYGLGLMVEILCGILSASHFGLNIRNWKSGDTAANLGHCFIVINPNAFDCGSKERLTILLKQMRDLPSFCNEPVLIAGDPEKQHMKKVDMEGGLTYHSNQLKILQEISKRIGVRPLKLISKSV
ncbi:Malate dehydrogenase [Atta colombica]|uniref:Malate dehydrogenase n=1 Tax=Atta colombica TaxID=520822 RepID=A0A195BPV2_9HYME|nr:PREDICTED: uncharacterized oxidoreductase YjmC [Atta colombica]KYM87522.1 Malate dehydrogenase [Atta colombica]